MIWYYLLIFFGNMLNLMFSFLPRVDELPFGMDGYLEQAVSTFKAFAEIFPPFEVVLQAFLFYLSFKIMMLTLRLLRIIR